MSCHAHRYLLFFKPYFYVGHISVAPVRTVQLASTGAIKLEALPAKKSTFLPQVLRNVFAMASLQILTFYLFMNSQNR